ncbi:MAG TPA: hypothetical protein VFM98_18710 [Ramlibacter sp.]|uniref:hypothetical protein n=1 Tax=Ramlibacter sp. TaxID=1917967 RepID=UPI002D7FF96E|nr:hypothetical protein [Ramlibacter sp.]HET8747637.1 hypothetical protein [Ramlibacter sp.]
MPENRRAVAVALATALLPLATRSQGEPDDHPARCCAGQVDTYRNYTLQALAGCSRWVEVRYRESISIVDGQKLRGCIDNGTVQSRKLLQTALRGVRRKGAREALRSYQSAFEGALAGVEPTVDEAAAAYDQRQISLRHLLAHAWTRYELEEV